MSDACLRAALAYGAEGLRVFPLHSMQGTIGADWVCSCDARCDSPGKHPRTSNGCKDATMDREAIAAWWNEWPDANVGVATGDGLLVVDLDGDEGCIALAMLCEAHGQLPITRYITTGREGGFHLWYRAKGPGVRNTTGSRSGIARGIDTRGEGGYVVAPPSNHESGRRYVGDDLPIADAPAWLLALLTPKIVERPAPAVVPVVSNETTPYGRKAIELECEKVRTASEGGRNDQLNASAYSLGQLEAGGEIAYGDAGPALEEAAAAAGLPSGQSRKTIYTSGLVKGRENPRVAPERDLRRIQSSSAGASNAPSAAAKKIAAAAQEAYELGDVDTIGRLIAVLGGDHEATAADPRSAVRAVGELARAAAQRRNGEALAAAIRATRMASAGTAA